MRRTKCNKCADGAIHINPPAECAEPRVTHIRPVPETARLKGGFACQIEEGSLPTSATA